MALACELNKCFSELSGLFSDPVDGSDLDFQVSQFIGRKGNSYVLEDNIADFHIAESLLGENITGSLEYLTKTSSLLSYEGINNRFQFREKINDNLLFNMLDAQLPRDAVVLEAGCGTGQLSNYLAMSPWRRVIGADIEQISLIEAEKFRCQFEINNSAFLRMNVFHMPFKPESFDVIISTAFLHRTGDAKLAFAKLVEKLKAGGLIVIGLYNRYAKFSTLIHANGSTFTQDEVLKWFDNNGIDFLSGNPALDGSVFDGQSNLYHVHSRSNLLKRGLSQLTMLFERRNDSDLFVMVGRKKQ